MTQAYAGLLLSVNFKDSDLYSIVSSDTHIRCIDRHEKMFNNSRWRMLWQHAWLMKGNEQSLCRERRGRKTTVYISMRLQSRLKLLTGMTDENESKGPDTGSSTVHQFRVSCLGTTWKFFAVSSFQVARTNIKVTNFCLLFILVRASAKYLFECNDE